jgi:hypothetical protein
MHFKGQRGDSPETQTPPPSNDALPEARNRPAPAIRLPEEVAKKQAAQKLEAAEKGRDIGHVNNVAAEMNLNTPPDAPQYERWIRNSEQALGIPQGTILVSTERRTAGDEYDRLIFTVNGAEMCRLDSAQVQPPHRQSYSVSRTVTEPVRRNFFQWALRRPQATREVPSTQACHCLTPSGIEVFLRAQKQRILHRAQMSPAEARLDAINIQTYNTYFREFLKDANTGNIVSLREENETLSRDVFTIPLSVCINGESVFTISCTPDMSPNLVHRVSRPNNGGDHLKFTEEGLRQILREHPRFLPLVRKAAGQMVLRKIAEGKPSMTFPGFRFENDFWQMRTNTGWQNIDSDKTFYRQENAIILVRNHPSETIRAYVRDFSLVNNIRLP